MEIIIILKTEDKKNKSAMLKGAIQTIADNINVDNLFVLAEKSKKPGINDKIKTFKHLI